MTMRWFTVTKIHGFKKNKLKTVRTEETYDDKSRLVSTEVRSIGNQDVTWCVTVYATFDDGEKMDLVLHSKGIGAEERIKSCLGRRRNWDPDVVSENGIWI